MRKVAAPQAFLEAVIEHGGNVTAACEDSGLSRSAVYALEKDDPAFAASFREARRRGLAALEDEARRRAFEGTEKPVFYQGAECGSLREYSDSLLALLLKAGLPEKYRDRVEHSGSVDMSAEVHIYRIPDNGRD